MMSIFRDIARIIGIFDLNCHLNAPESSKMSIWFALTKIFVECPKDVQKFLIICPEKNTSRLEVVRQCQNPKRYQKKKYL